MLLAMYAARYSVLPMTSSCAATNPRLWYASERARNGNGKWWSKPKHSPNPSATMRANAKLVCMIVACRESKMLEMMTWKMK
ncbi:MAG: hypothetical protein ACHQHM_04360 [Thermoanaerobaculales bacterium]